MGQAHRRKGKPKTFAGVVTYGKKQVFACKHPHQSREAAANCATDKATDLDREASGRTIPDPHHEQREERQPVPEVYHTPHGIGY